MLRIWLGNIGKYNEGELVGEWFDLPFNEDDWDDMLDKIQLCNENREWCNEFGCPYEEWFIADYESDIPGLKIGEYDNVMELNEIAERYEDLDRHEKVAFAAFIQNGSDFEEAIDGADGGDYRIYYGCDSMKDVAWECMEEYRYLAEHGNGGIPSLLMDYFDYEAYGRDLETSGTFIGVDEGYVEIW